MVGISAGFGARALRSHNGVAAAHAGLDPQLWMPPKGVKKGTNAAPWWWEPAICELWAAGGKDKHRQKFYDVAVTELD